MEGHGSRPRVVVADDSALMRRLLADALAGAGCEVAGLAADGDEALRLCRRERPHVLTLDIAMPGLNGLGVLRALRDAGRGWPLVVVVSAFSPAFGVRAVDALAEGAFELVAKPTAGEELTPFLTELVRKVRLAVRAAGRRALGGASAPHRRQRQQVQPGLPGRRVVVIASSTGGPRALAQLVPQLPSPLGQGTVIVQHMPAGFTTCLAARLDGASSLSVCEAVGGERVEPTVALLAPGGRHLRFDEHGTVRLSDEPGVHGLRPRADLTIIDLARIYGDRLLLVVLTGMGKDGLEGARNVKRCGGRVLAEAESSCTIYGMPRVVAEAGLADRVLELADLPEAIVAEAAA